MLFVAAGVTDTKVRHSTGVATTNSTNKNPNANKLSWAINYKLSWSLIARTYSPSLDICLLCLTEELMLMQQPALGTLYVEDEFMFCHFLQYICCS